MNIWDLAKEKIKEQETKHEELDEKLDNNVHSGSSEIRRRRESITIISGSKQTGKTTFILKYLERNEEPKPTVALDYVFGRRTRGKIKDLCNIYEIGGGIRLTNLLSIPLNEENIDITCVVIVLDLTKPYEMWTTLEGIISSVKKTIETITREFNRSHPARYQQLQDAQQERLKNYGEQLRMCSPLLIPLLIVGAKYDEFQNMESEQRRNICQCLRFVSFYYGGALMFYSARNEGLVRQGRAMLSHFALETSISKNTVTDHNKPLFIPVGADSLQDIGAPPLTETSFARASQPIELWKEAFCSLFPQKDSNELGEDPTIDPLFKEPIIDKMIEQKTKDLVMYQKQKRDRVAAEEKAKERIAGI